MAYCSLPGFRCGRDDGLIVVEQAQRQEALLGIEPHALDRIELGPVGRQRHQRDVGWHAEPLAGVPACAVENQRDMLVVPDRRGERIEECVPPI